MHLFQKYIATHTQPLKDGGPDTSKAHILCTQQILSVNVSIRAAQCQISWSATARKHQRDSLL